MTSKKHNEIIKRNKPMENSPSLFNHNNDSNDDSNNSDDDESNYRKLSEAQKKHLLRRDYGNIALLIFLYLLQGLPLGLTSSLPYILSSKKVSYADQGTFSFAFWPFSLKLLWAPLVDAIYVKKFGRRKSWLIPVQYAIGIFMFTFSDYVNHLLEQSRLDTTDSKYGIYAMTAVFFMFTFLAATQDIVVDAWALTMLSKENVAWASTCNSVGQSAGWFIGNVVFLTLESSEFCNKYVRYYLGLPNQTFGLVTLNSFMHFFGFLFIISTTLVMIFKKERPEKQVLSSKKSEFANYEEKLSIRSTYKLMWSLLWIPPVKKLIFILLTFKIGFATESMSFLKLIEQGVPKEKLGLLAVPLTPLQIFLPLIISRYSNGPEPFTLLIKAMPFRMFMGIVTMVWVYITPYFKDENNDYPFKYYIGCLLINAIHSIFMYTMFVTQVSFFAKVSDKKIGGTYMTFLNTMSNLGGNWPGTCALYVASFITMKYCYFDASIFSTSLENKRNATFILNTVENNFCETDEQSKNCLNIGGKCLIKLDAYYVETIICCILGMLWLVWKRNLTYKLQHLPKSAWKVSESYIRKLIS